MKITKLAALLLYFITFYACSPCYSQIKISQLPLNTAANVGINDSFPYVGAANGITYRLTLFDLVNIPGFAITYAPLAAPHFTGTVNMAGLTASQAVATDSSKNLVSLAYSAVLSNSNLVSRDASGNTQINSLIDGYATTATAAGTTTLTVASTAQQYFTGSTTQTVVLPVTSTLVLGQHFNIINNSSGVVTVQSSGANTIQAMAANTRLVVTVILTSGTTASSWNAVYSLSSSTGTVSSVALSVPGVLSISGSPVTTTGTLAIGYSGTALPIANGGTGSVSAPTQWGLIYASATTTLASTTAGTAGQVPMSNASSAPTYQTVPGNTTILKAPTIQKFTSGSGTYTTPTSPGPIYIQVEMVGGGGGGAGSGLSGGGAGTSGNATTFGTTLLNAGGGGGGNFAGGGGGGGTVSLGSGPIGIAIAGGTGSDSESIGSAATLYGGGGGSSALGGASGAAKAAGVSAAANSGSGGSGGGTNGVSSVSTGGGGGAGGYIKAIITSPASTYAYTVGASVSGGTNGGSGLNGGGGAAGIVVVTEYYQ